MVSRYILAIDQGTTGSTALIFDQTLNIVGQGTVDFPQHFPQPQWVEHDLNEIWDSVLKSIAIALQQSKIDGSAIAAIGITNQRETTCLWERETGKPVCRAIVWQDRRTSERCQSLKRKGKEPLVRKKTGLLLDPYFSGTKLQWMLEKDKDLKRRAKAKEICFGTIESFLLFRLTGVHATEPSNACRTMLMNLKTCDWDADLLTLFGIPKECLPEIFPSQHLFGKTRNVGTLPDGVPVSGIVGDQQAALFGQACFQRGSAKSTYGTGAFILANIGDKPVLSKHRLLTSVAWKIGNKTTYCLEGSAFVAGAAVQWLRDGLNLFEKSDDVERLAASVTDSDGVVFVPALAGMGAPHWLPTATGMLSGLTRRTTKAHVARATLDGIAFQVRELLEAMNHDFGRKIGSIKVDGGASANDLLMQFQADLIGVPVVRSRIVETTALGAGLMAGLQIGFWKNLAEIESLWKGDKIFKPEMKAKDRKLAIDRWDRAIAGLKATVK